MFKDKLKELRMQKGISQYELAENLFVSRSAIAKWENGNPVKKFSFYKSFSSWKK